MSIKYVGKQNESLRLANYLNTDDDLTGQTEPVIIIKSNLFLLCNYSTFGNNRSNLPFGSDDISIFLIYLIRV